MTIAQLARYRAEQRRRRTCRRDGAGRGAGRLAPREETIAELIRYMSGRIASLRALRLQSGRKGAL
jgi:hypothetical protein